MRDTAQSITRVASDANGEAVVAASATEQASRSVNAVASAAEELLASVEKISRQVHQSATVVDEAGEPTDKSIAVGIRRSDLHGAEPVAGSRQILL